MEKYIRVLEEEREMLIKHHEEMVENIKIITDSGVVSGDDKLRSIVGDMMRRAAHIGTCINIIENDIRDLKRKNRFV